MPLRDTNCCLLGSRNHRHTPSWLFQYSILQGQLDLLPFAPRLLSYLRIKHRVTVMPARLDTRPVASGYRGGIRTRLNNAAFPSRNRVFTSIDRHPSKRSPTRYRDSSLNRYYCRSGWNRPSHCAKSSCCRRSIRCCRPNPKNSNDRTSRIATQSRGRRCRLPLIHPRNSRSTRHGLNRRRKSRKAPNHWTNRTAIRKGRGMRSHYRSRPRNS